MAAIPVHVLEDFRVLDRYLERHAGHRRLQPGGDPYRRYRRGGDFHKVMRILGRLAQIKHEISSETPFINWRYILFRWNDSDREMQLARRMAADIGVDRLCWEITDHPEEGFSRRFVPGSAALASVRHEVWDDNNLGNAIPGATPRARIELRGIPRGVPLAGEAGGSLTLQTRVRNLSKRAFPHAAPYGRRLVRLGAQLCSGNGELRDRDLARAALPHALEAGQHLDLPIEVRLPEQPGRYRLAFDLVYEGIDWFADCGSEVTTRDLVVG